MERDHTKHSAVTWLTGGHARTGQSTRTDLPRLPHEFKLESKRLTSTGIIGDSSGDCILSEEVNGWGVTVGKVWEGPARLCWVPPTATSGGSLTLMPYDNTVGTILNTHEIGSYTPPLPLGQDTASVRAISNGTVITGTSPSRSIPLKPGKVARLKDDAKGGPNAALKGVYVEDLRGTESRDPRDGRVYWDVDLYTLFLDDDRLKGRSSTKALQDMCGDLLPRINGGIPPSFPPAVYDGDSQASTPTGTPVPTPGTSRANTWVTDSSGPVVYTPPSGMTSGTLTPTGDHFAFGESRGYSGGRPGGD